MLSALIGLALVVLALHDGFEVMVLPRRVTRRWRLARFFYRTSWRVWRQMCLLIPAGRHRKNILSVFGPLSLFGLIIGWVTMLICGFALVHFGLGTLPEKATGDFFRCLYFSGETFFTLGYGDVTAGTRLGMCLSVVEAGTGFGFMAVTIGYLPVLYQAFSSRERNIALLDARAGSPPAVSELLRRAGPLEPNPEIDRFLAEWEVWAAELLESHLSFPVLSYYHSQHDNQSWLAALALVLDTSAALIVVDKQSSRRRAELTFAMARHACVDLCLVFGQPPVAPPRDRLTAAEAQQLLSPHLASDNVDPRLSQRLAELRVLYEPFIQALANYFDLNVPRFFPDRNAPDNWQTSAWTQRAPGITELPGAERDPGEHFG